MGKKPTNLYPFLVCFSLSRLITCFEQSTCVLAWNEAGEHFSQALYNSKNSFRLSASLISWKICDTRVWQRNIFQMFLNKI